MEDINSVTRRTFVTTGAALTMTLAGCGSNGGSGSTEDDTETPEDDNQTPEGNSGTPEGDGESPEETTPQDPSPSLSEFEYPEGATQDGIDARTLFTTHESKLTDAGSLTFTSERTVSFGDFGSTTTRVNEFDSNNVFIEKDQTDDSPTEYIWSPADEDLALVQMESGFETKYRIDNSAPDTNQVTGLSFFAGLLPTIEWGEATEVVETSDGFGVVYNSTGVSDPRRFAQGGEIESFDASVTVAESGHISGLSYDVTLTGTDLEEQQVSLSVQDISETSVDQPEWTSTAREEGVQFDVNLTSDGTAYELEMVNGSEVPADARVRLRADQGSASNQLSQALSVGDTLYLGLSNNGELVMETNQAPTEASELSGRTSIAIRSPFVFLEYSSEI